MRDSAVVRLCFMETFMSAIMLSSAECICTRSISMSGQWTWVHDVLHHLWSTMWTFVQRINSPFAQISSTRNLLCLKSVQHGPQLVKEVTA